MSGLSDFIIRVILASLDVLFDCDFTFLTCQVFDWSIYDYIVIFGGSHFL